MRTVNGGAGGGGKGGGDGGGAGGGEGGGGLGGLAGGENAILYSRHGESTAMDLTSEVALGWAQIEQQAPPTAAASLLSQLAVEWVSPQKTKISVTPSSAVAAHDAQLIGGGG